MNIKHFLFYLGSIRIKCRYRVGYFIINEKDKYPGKAKKIESGFSEYIEIK